MYLADGMASLAIVKTQTKNTNDAHHVNNFLHTIVLAIVCHCMQSA